MTGLANDFFHSYSDESGFPADRFQALAVVSGKPADLSILRSCLKGKLGNGVKEVKCEEVRGHRPKTEAAVGYLELAITYAVLRKIRIDVLAWDTHDQRHAIHGRDDVANLERMYYKDMIHIARRWNNPKWALFPDENSAINWLEIIGYLNNTRLQKPRFMSLFQDGPSQFIEFQEISQRCSSSEPLVQLADLFAGMTAFCRLKGGNYANWERQEKNKQQPSLFEFEEAEDESSRADRVRYGIVRFFREKCTHHSLVSWLRNRYTTEF